MEQEFSDLIPVFVEEARDRIDRLASRVPQLGHDDDALVVVKRELHTLKGSARMLQLGPMAELCHAAEDAIHGEAPELESLLTRSVDRLAEMLATVAEGGMPAAATELVAELRGGSVPKKSSGKPAAKKPAAKAKGGAKKKPARRKPAAKKPPAEEAAKAEQANVEDEPGETAEPVEPADGGEVRIDVELPAAVDAAAAGAAADGEAPVRGPAASLTSADIRVDATALDEVADRATQLRLMALAATRVGERLYELAHLAEDGLQEPQPKQVLAVLSAMLRRQAVELEGDQRLMLRAADSQLDQVLTLQLQPLRGPLLSMARYARQIATSLGREVEVTLEGQDTRLDRRIARDLEDSLIHLVRNAVDHGLEPPDAREAAGKPRAGKLVLRATTSGSRVRLEIKDDGPGVDPERVIAQAVKHGLVDRASAGGLGREEAFRLLFTPGFSTRREISELSGRGVGLDVVASAVARVGGEVFLRSETGQGTLVAVEVPMARRGEQVLVLRLGEVRLALPSAVVRGAHEVTEADFVERSGRPIARVDGRLIPFVPLADVYGETAAEVQLLLEGTVSGQRLALTVDDVEGEEEVLVRPLPGVLENERMLEGIALLSSGNPVAVLSPTALARRELLRTRPRARRIEPVRKVRVLLVDDSLVTREMERRLLEDAGFVVIAAADADEALGRLGEETFDCVVTDIEMPGMDGFELTEHLRSMEHFAQLPIIVVSTRDRPEDRLRGLRAGADAYLTKQSLDAGELVDLVRRLAGR
ncbi:MAG TPA: response regulator [Thermoanaerobaculia bacterium]|nr:response regulator [Thermoanaerobaculia bacterium]